MSAYTIYKELFPPQTVEHVKRAHFTSPEKINLIVAKSSLLQVYDFVEFTPAVDGYMHDATNGVIEADGEETGEVEEDDTEAQERFHGQDEQALVYPKLRPLKKDVLGTNSGRLELVAQYKLNGNIATMGVIRTSSARGNQGCDSILLGFNDAKMSLLEWSPSTNNIVTVSIHYYEKDDLKKEFLANPYSPDIHIDPQQRCAVLNFYGDKLAVLPFRQSESRGKDYEGDEERQKWPYSPSFVVDLESIDKRIKNVIDMAFLEGYYEPTLAILFQTTQTWTGRLASSKDTVSVVVISLDLSAKIYPVIYSLDNLPYDCHKLVAMPRPVNGLLIIAANSLLHVSQGSPGVGVAVNGYCKAATEFSGMIYNDEITRMGLSLDGARAMTVFGGLCLLFLQSGEWVVVKPTLDGSKVVGMELTKIDWPSKAMSTVKRQKSKRSDAPNPKVPLALMPTCVASIKDREYFFLGSRVGNSLLIKWRNTNSASLADTAGMAFRVCDVLLNTGPIMDMAIGQAEVDQRDSSTQQQQNITDLELVSCSGHDKNGSLCVLQRHARPETTFSFEHPGSESVWSIKCRKEQYFEGVRIGTGVSGWEASNDEDDPFFEMYDKLLFISKSTQTLILAAGEELQELEHTDFYTAGPTVAVGTVLNHTKIVQIQANAVFLLSPNGKLSQTINLKQSIIVDACIQDPYVLLRMDNSSITVLKVDAATRQLASMSLPPHVNSKNVSMASIFIDTSGIFSRISEKRLEVQSRRQRREKVSEKKRKAEDELLSEATGSKKPFMKRASITDFDEVDMDLYGDQDEPDQVNNMNGTTATKNNDTLAAVSKSAFDEEDDDEDLYGDSKALADDQMEEPDTQGEVDEINVSTKGNMAKVTKKTYWCLIYGNDRVLRLYSLPEFEECFATPQFNMLRGLVIDRPTDASSLSKVPTSASAQQLAEDIIDEEIIQEILLANIGRETKHPHLIVRTNTNDIIIYKAFTYLPDPANDYHDADEDLTDYHAEKIHDTRLALRFSRLHHEYVSRCASEESNSTTEKTRQRHLLVPFQNVAGYTGVFLAGPQPAWLICSCKSFVRVHPMKPGKHSIVGFTQFHNVNCDHGFITVDSSARLCLSRLPTDSVTYDMDWIMQKIPLGKTAHKIVYHPTMKVYSALVSSPKPVLLRNDDGIPIDGRDESSRTKGEFLPVVESFSLIMISPVTWEIVDRYDFQEYEQGLSLHCSLLESKQTSSGKKHFITVGTGFLRGEDTAMRGSIHIFDIIEVVPEPDNPQTNHKYKQLHTEEVKGAVSAVCDVSGHLVSCIGSKVIIWSFEDNESLVGVAFIDVQIYVTSIASIKNFIVLGDAQKSVWFLGFQLEPAKLALLGKDYQSFEVSSVDFIIDDKSLYLLVGDTDDNLDIFQYAPFNLQSFAGQKLLRRGDFHVGSQVRTMVRLPQIIHKNSGVEYSRRHFCICGTFGGSISIVSPIPEKTFKRLNTLYGQLVNGLQHVAGLNPRAYRLMKGPKQRMSSNRTKAVLDGDLIFHFAGLSINHQREMTKQIGTTVPRIMEDLVEIDSSIDHF